MRIQFPFSKDCDLATFADLWDDRLLRRVILLCLLMIVTTLKLKITVKLMPLMSTPILAESTRSLYDKVPVEITPLIIHIAIGQVNVLLQYLLFVSRKLMILLLMLSFRSFTY